MANGNNMFTNRIPQWLQVVFTVGGAAIVIAVAWATLRSDVDQNTEMISAQHEFVIENRKAISTAEKAVVRIETKLEGIDRNITEQRVILDDIRQKVQ